MYNEEKKMYNEEQKLRFIENYTQSPNTRKIAATLFLRLAPFEEEWQSDLCTKSTQELQPVIDKVVALRFRSQWMSLNILKEYVKWCMMMRFPGACDGMLHITVAGLDKVKRQMVSSPLHLQQYLDAVFKKEEKQMLDNLYRCYYWMAYGGVRDQDILSVKVSDVDFNKMCIRYRDTSVPIYREALPAFHNAVELKGFLYEHPNYDPIWRDRAPGDTLIRGYHAITQIKYLRSNMSHLSADAIQRGKTDLHLSFNRVWMSGLFYRMYERERAGLTVDFTGVAEELMSGKDYVIKGRTTIEHRQKQRGRDIMEDYQRWKLAFSI